MDLDNCHIIFKRLTQNKEIDLQENFNILLESSQLSQDEVVARYVLNLINIKDIIIENKDKLSKSLFILKICQKYPFLSSLDGRQFFYVAEGIMPSNN